MAASDEGTTSHGYLRENLGRAYRLLAHGDRLGRARNYRRWKRFVTNRDRVYRELEGQEIELRSHPLILTLDPATVCNLRCPFCPTGGGYGGFARELLTPETFERITSHLDVDLLEEVILYNWGEPLLNPHLDAYIRFFSERGKRTEISTNLSQRDYSESFFQQLVESGLGTMIVSIDGARQESYERYRVRGSFDRVVANMARMADVKRSLGSERPRVVYKMLLHRHNQHEIESARRIAEGVGAEFLLNERFWCPEENEAEWLPDLGGEVPSAPHPQGFSSEVEEVISTYCRQLWTSVVVSANGDVFPCCLLYEPSHATGNLRDQSIDQIRNNDEMKTLRRFVTDRTAGSPPFTNACVSCSSRWCTVKHLSDSTRSNRGLE